ncbi:TolB family protein [Methylocucumis oryzae]|uniref:TolB family protein n=1 Tax=Methylocucumis oryzae TaxID=1632867 RepID=UPI0019553CAA|nr:PD40 domain-containing protein [Methylocucumis oryzae]
MHDLETKKKTTRVSVATSGLQGNNGSWHPKISADGRYVTFWSSASTLVPNDTNVTDDAFVHDTLTHETKRISVASDGTQGNGSSGRPSISADGRYIGFSSEASNLATNDDNGDADVFVHDQVTGTTTLVSVTLDGTSGTGPGAQAGANNTNGSRDAIISSDGHYMAFRSLVTDLIPNDTNEEIDVFLRDLTQ